MKITVDVSTSDANRIGGAVARAYGRTPPTTPADARKIIGEVLADHLTRIVVGVEQADAQQAAQATVPQVTPPAVTLS